MSEPGFFSRMADAFYGPQGAGPGERAYLFGPEYTSRFDYLQGWRPDLVSPSPFGPPRATGYFRFNTGNPERDAIMSILANEFGLDNYVRGVAMANDGNWFQSGPGVGALGQLAMGAFEAAGAVPIAKGLYGAARGIFNLPDAVRAFRGARNTVPSINFPTAPAGTVSLGSGVPTQPSLFGAAASSPVTFTGTTVLPSSAINPVGRGASIPAAAGAATVALRGGRRFAKPVASAAAADRGLLRRAGSAALRRTPQVSLAATVGEGAYLGVRGEPAATATELAAAETPPAPTVPTPTRTTAAPRPDTPAPTDGETQPDAGDAGGSLRMDVGGIQRQYNNLLRDLRGMYQTTETDEERERVRMILADIEAQRDAGLEALASGYAAAESNIRERGVAARAGGEQRAAAAGERLSGVGSDLEQRLVDQQAASAAANRGLGVGAAVVDPTNEWVNLINTLAPIQQTYLSGMGDITGEGIDWMADTAALQGQAQSADLQRLAMSTQVAAEMSERRRIADRIQRERELERQAIMQLGIEGIGAAQAAQQFNAGLAADERRLATAEAQAAEQRRIDIANTIGTLAAQGLDPIAIQNRLYSMGLGQMTPEQFQTALDAAALFRQQNIVEGQVPVNPYASSGQNAPAGGR